MVTRPHRWISLWFLLSIPVIFWDASYILLRPRSFRGGDLHWIWEPYGLYQDIDFVYGVRAYARGDGFPGAQSAMNLAENVMNIFYLYLAHGKRSSAAPLVGFASVVMTLWKTVLYWTQEYFCDYCSIGHNDLRTLVIFWAIPNGIWLLIPGLIVYQLGKDIIRSLRQVDAASEKLVNGKAH